MEAMDLSLDHYTRIYRKTMEDSLCFLAHWELTYRCNLRCRHCYVSGDNRRREFSYEKAQAIIDELKDLGCLYLTLSGGEILIRNDFFAIASYARKKGFALRLMTNATLIDEAVSGRMASLCPLTVETSIYAARGDLHDAITSVSGSFDKTIRAVELLKKRQLRVVIKFLIMQDNVKEFAAVKSLAQGLDVDFLFDFCLVAKDNGSRIPLAYRLNREQIRELLLSNNFDSGEREPAETELLCSAGVNNICISPYLDVYPCIGIKYKIGNIEQISLQDIWRSPQLNFIRGIEVSSLAECQTCPSMQFCNRCPGMALAEDGDMFGPSTFDCLVAGIAKEIKMEKGGIRDG
jgi:radical SAM protein with 4Fe4S-binding SPASM domain